jgi:hypothetical protein
LPHFGWRPLRLLLLADRRERQQDQDTEDSHNFLFVQKLNRISNWTVRVPEAAVGRP